MGLRYIVAECLVPGRMTKTERLSQAYAEHGAISFPLQFCRRVQGMPGDERGLRQRFCRSQAARALCAQPQGRDRAP